MNQDANMVDKKESNETTDVERTDFIAAAYENQKNDGEGTNEDPQKLTVGERLELQWTLGWNDRSAARSMSSKRRHITF